MLGSAGMSSLTLKTLLKGDANQGCVINSLDYAPLATAYGTLRGQPGFDRRL